MATDNLSYQEVKDHNELMDSMRNVMSKASSLFTRYDPNQIAAHNVASNAHADIRQALATVQAAVGSGNTEISNAVDTLRDSTNGKFETIDTKIAAIESAKTAQDNSSIESSISTITNVNNEQGTNIATLQNSVSEINTTIAPITSAELSTMVNEKFTRDTIRDGGMWRDESYIPFINEDNVRDGYAGTEKPHVVNNP